MSAKRVLVKYLSSFDQNAAKSPEQLTPVSNYYTLVDCIVLIAI